MKSVVLILWMVSYVFGQNVGTVREKDLLNFNIQSCSAPGDCQIEQNAITLDSNWRWIHQVKGGSANCFGGEEQPNSWDQNICPDVVKCTESCGIEGIGTREEWNKTYGVKTNRGSLSLRFYTKAPFSQTIGATTFLLNSTKNGYRMFNLLNKEFSFDVNVSTLGCGLNGALYFVQMDADGGAGRFATNKAGAAFGTGYCDSKCPRDLKWINGMANSENWTPSKDDVNGGTGRYGSCCPELRIWDSNSISQSFSTHLCEDHIDGQTQCDSLETSEGIKCEK